MTDAELLELRRLLGLALEDETVGGLMITRRTRAGVDYSRAYFNTELALEARGLVVA